RGFRAWRRWLGAARWSGGSAVVGRRFQQLPGPENRAAGSAARRIAGVLAGSPAARGGAWEAGDPAVRAGVSAARLAGSSKCRGQSPRRLCKGSATSVFAPLSDRLTAALSGLRGKGRLSDADIAATGREIRIALLEADVALPVVRQFIAQIKQRAKGAEVSA